MILSRIWSHVSHKKISFHKIPPSTFLLSTNVANSLSLDLWVWWIWIFSGPKNKLIDLEELITSTPQTLLQCAVLFNSCCLHLKNVTYSFALPLPLDLMNLKHLLIVNPQNKRSFIDLEELIRETKFSKGEIRLYINISIIVPLLTFTFQIHFYFPFSWSSYRGFKQKCPNGAVNFHFLDSLDLLQWTFHFHFHCPLLGWCIGGLNRSAQTEQWTRTPSRKFTKSFFLMEVSGFRYLVLKWNKNVPKFIIFISNLIIDFFDQMWQVMLTMFSRPLMSTRPDP